MKGQLKRDFSKIQPNPKLASLSSNKREGSLTISNILHKENKVGNFNS